MHFTTIASLLLASTSLTSAALLIARQSGLPSCFTDCTLGPNVDYHGCGQTDNPCLCRNAAFVKEQTACLQSTCNASDLATSVSISTQLCASVGVTEAPEPTTSEEEASSSSAPEPSTSEEEEASSSSAPASSTGASSNTAASTTGPASSSSTTRPTSSTASAPAQTSNAALASSSGSQLTFAVLALALGVVAL